MSTPLPARYLVTKTDGDLVQTISTCMGHLPATMAELGSVFVHIKSVEPENLHIYDCMGCIKGWSKGDA